MASEETQEPVAKKKKKKVVKKDKEKKPNSEEDVEEEVNLKIGSLMLGCVMEINDFGVVVGLPSGIIGRLPIYNLSDTYSRILNEKMDTTEKLEEIVPLSQLFTPGLVIRCAVSSLGEKEGQISLKVSINPKEVNKGFSSGSLKSGMTLSGCVDSVEDHGYLVDIGICGTRAFLPKKSTSSKQDLHVGQYVETLIEEVKDNGRVVRLSNNSQELGKTCARFKDGWTLDNLLPGLLVKASVKKVTPHGLILGFLSSFTGMVDFLHLDEASASTYNTGSEVVARILYVDPSSKQVSLSLLSHLLPPGGAMLDIYSSERVGEVQHGCKMTALHHSSGAIMEIPDGTTAFVRKCFLKEHKDELNANRLLALKEHSLRLISFSPLEQIHLATLRRSMIEAKFFSYQDVKVGQIIEGTITDLQKHAAYVWIADHITGNIPNIHMADVVLKNPEKALYKGLKVKCRVLSVEPELKKLTLTRKKTLLESTLPIFKSYADARVGRISHGCIVCVKEFGCIVCFYGDVKGLVPKHEMTAENLEKPEELFFVGQVVKAKVLRCDQENKKLKLSFKAVTEWDINQEITAKFDFMVGKSVETRVIRKMQDGLEVSIIPDEVPAFIPTVHLSDHVTNCVPLWTAMEEGDDISNVMCLSNNKKGITLTKKPLLVACLEDKGIPKEFSELQVGIQMVGWVKNIMPFGVFVDFPHGLYGLAPKSAMSDKFLSDISAAFAIGQTVLAKVTNIDEEKKRFLVSLKESELSLAADWSESGLVEGLKERKTISEMSIRDKSEDLQQLFAVYLGKKMKMTVGETREDGAVTLTANQLKDTTVLASKYHAQGLNVTPGTKLKAVILHVDPLKSEVHVSLLPKLVAKKKKLAQNSTLTATIQFTDEDFAVISLGDTGHLTIVPTRAHLNSIFNPTRFSVGSSLNVIVKEVESEKLGGLPLVSCQTLNTCHEQIKAKNQNLSHISKIGELFMVKVKKVSPMGVLVTLPSGTLGNIHVSEVMESPVVGSFPTSSLKYDKRNQCLEVHVKHNIMGTVELLNIILKPTLAKHPSALFKQGQAVSAKVVSVSSSRPLRLALSFTGNHNLEPGMVTMAMIHKVLPHLGLLLKLPFGNTGLASVTDLSDVFTDKPLESYKEGQIIRCWTIGKEKGKFIVSLRPSRLHKERPGNITDPEIQSVSDIKKGQMIKGYVSSFNDLGIFVILSRTITGRIRFQNATKYCIEDPKDISQFIALNTLVAAKVLRVNTQKGHVDLSLLAEDTGNSDLLQDCLELRVSGEETVEHVEKTAQRKRALSKREHKHIENEEVKTKKKKIESDSTLVEKPKLVKPDKEKKKRKSKLEDSDSGVEVFFREADDSLSKKNSDYVKAKRQKQEPSRLQVAFDFPWESTLGSLTPFAPIDDPQDSSGDEQEAQSKPVKKSRKELKQELKTTEQQLSHLEAELMDTSVRPNSTEAFERLLLSSPDSSLLWLQYMAFHLQATQIEQARTIAERALKTISFREEQEKLNVWVAMLNLENMYGTPESLEKVFERAIQFCDPLPVYQQLADIYAKSDKIKEAESLYKSMVKRFSQEKAVYLSYGTFLLRQRKSDAANSLLQRALQSLSSKEHVDLIAKFARLEFQYGNSERAKSMFDKVLTTYPKRTDLWSVFIDLMEKHGSQKEKIKFFFKRFLEYEKKSGTPESIQAVKQKAFQYVESKGTEATN
ncbi:hypothetical protein DNTS_002546 [Danionella cerebrum]|uniref:Protein RRP5 homolog n=1 Tax=Danionella cerebrum TaxID=2873325 RepID=A0A553MSN1_9TELE|nr:hypothetical protein DNTS_002546 [Danionella translucida]